MYDRLKYLQPGIGSMISQAAACGEFEQLEFLHECDAQMRTGKGFAESWSKAVARSTDIMGKESASIVANLSEVLGRSDLESQLSALEYGKSRLESRLIEAREYTTKHKKLYQTLGVLVGLGIAVLAM